MSDRVKDTENRNLRTEPEFLESFDISAEQLQQEQEEYGKPETEFQTYLEAERNTKLESHSVVADQSVQVGAPQVQVPKTLMGVEVQRPQQRQPLPKNMPRSERQGRSRETQAFRRTVSQARPVPPPVGWEINRPPEPQPQGEDEGWQDVPNAPTQYEVADAQSRRRKANRPQGNSGPQVDFDSAGTAPATANNQGSEKLAEANHKLDQLTVAQAKQESTLQQILQKVSQQTQTKTTMTLG